MTSLRKTSRPGAAAAVVAVWVMVLTGSADAAPWCGPAVTLVGDGAVIAMIASSLRDHGIAAPREGCPAEVAEVMRRDDALVVSIVDAEGRRTERTVHDVATAAILIESFAPVAITVPVVAAALNAEPSVPAAIFSAERGALPHGGFGAAIESSLASDRSLWYGVRAHGCVDLGEVCVGGQARFARDAGIAGDAVRAGSSRLAADVLLVVDHRLVLAGLGIVPGVGIGVGWLHGRGAPDSSGDTFDVDAGGLRADVHVMGKIAIARGLLLTIGVTCDVAPFAHVAPYVDGTRAIAGEPRGFGRLALGLEAGRR